MKKHEVDDQTTNEHVARLRSFIWLGSDLSSIVLIVAIALGYMITRSTVAWFAAAVLLFILLYFLVMLLMYTLRNLQVREHREYEAAERRLAPQLDAIYSLSGQSAQCRAIELLKEGDRFSCEPNGETLSQEMRDTMSPLLRDFFGRYRSVSVACSDSTVGHEWFQRSDANADVFRIGVSIEHTEFVFQRGCEDIFLMEDSIASVEEAVEVYPSIYHWVLIENLRLYES